MGPKGGDGGTGEGANGNAGGTGGEGAGTGAGEGANTGTGGCTGEGGCGSTSELCGNFVIDPGEDCDDFDIGDATCESLKLPGGGDPLCDANCKFDTSVCVPETACFDFEDNNNNIDIDCEDADCKTVCEANPCDQLQALEPGVPVTNWNFGHKSSLHLGCAEEFGGDAIAYSFTADKAGLLNLTLNSGAWLDVVVRGACEDAESELGCLAITPGVDGLPLQISVEEGQELTVFVAGSIPGENGTYELTADIIVPGCGNDNCEPDEECDDANEVSGDGCSSDCKAEATEVEPNDDLEHAEAYPGDAVLGKIDGSPDFDLFSFQVDSVAKPIFVSATATNQVTGICGAPAGGLYLEILNAEGAILGTSDFDDSANAEANVPMEATGTYFARLRSLDVPETGVVFYNLTISLVVPE